jgi:peptidoglycan/LPS O-acetylase OafA/YrhL
MVGLTLLISMAWQAIGMRVGALANSLPWTNSVISLWIVWTTGAFLAEAWQKGLRLLGALELRDGWYIFGVLLLACWVVPLNALLQYAAGIIGVLLMDAFLHAGKITVQSRPARLIVTIGLCSFSMFLIHQPLLQVMIDFLDLHSPHYPGYRLVDGAIVSLLIFGLSYTMYRFIEQPSIRTGARLLA